MFLVTKYKIIQNMYIASSVHTKCHMKQGFQDLSG